MEQREISREIEIDLKELLSVLLRRFWIIVMTGIGVMLAVFLLCNYAIEPKYEATTKIYVLNKQDSKSVVTYNDLQTGAQLTKDYMTLITSRPVTEQVIAELGLEMTHEELAKLISVNNPTDTRILEITVKYKDPFLAKNIADAARNVSEEHITQVMDIEQVNVVEEANIPETPSDPNIMMDAILGGVLGIIIAIVIILFQYFMNDTIKTPEDIEKYLGISILSSIPLHADINELDRKERKIERRLERKRMK